MSVRFAEGGKERILQQALALSGVESAPLAGEMLEVLASLSTAWCGRSDIPEAMEGTLAVLLCRQLQGEGDRQVSSVKRGDTTITYEQVGSSSMEALLRPFVRLKTPERGRWEC